MNLLARRPDVIAARARIEAADAGTARRQGGVLSDVSLTAFAGFASFSLSDLLGAKSFGYGAGPGLSLPLFDAGRLRAQYRGAEATLDEAVADYNDTVLRAVHAGGRPAQPDRCAERRARAAAPVARCGRGSLSARRGALSAPGLAGYLSVLNAETEVLSARRQQRRSERFAGPGTRHSAARSRRQLQYPRYAASPPDEAAREANIQSARADMDQPTPDQTISARKLRLR